MSSPRSGKDSSAALPCSARERAEQALRERIERGVYHPGSVLPTERQLVAEIGISRPVVRDAIQSLAEKGWIARDHGHRPRVALAPPGIGHRAGRDAASGSRPALKAVAAVMPLEPSYPAAYNILRGMQRTLTRQESAHRLVVFDTLAAAVPQSGGRDLSAWADGERQILETVSADGIAGVVLWHVGGAETLPVVTTLRERGVPIIFVDRFPDSPGAPQCDFVGVDNRSGARDAVNYLISLGHRRIVHLTTLGRGVEGDSLPVRERFEGYREALWENGILFDPDLVCGRTPDALDRIRADRNSGAPATAVFAVNDGSAHRFIETAATRGIRVPEDVSVIGFDDLDRYSHRSSVLTTVHLPFEAVGERAAELLLQRLRTAPVPAGPVVHTLLSTSLVVRETCRQRETTEGRPEPESISAFVV